MIRRLLSLPIVAYRTLVSPFKPRCCRFEPTCSQYALDALRERGVCVGILLTVWRLLRCQPFAAPGFDPVPPRRAATGRPIAPAGDRRPDS